MNAYSNERFNMKNYCSNFILIIVFLFLLIGKGTSKQSDISLDHILSITDDGAPGLPYIRSIQDASFSPAHEVLVLDSAEKKVYVYNRMGKYITATGNRGRGPGELLLPTSVIGDQNGRIWIADLSNAKISVRDQHFEHLQDIHFRQGWNTGFKKNKTDLFVRTFPTNSAPGAFDPVKIFKIDQSSMKMDLMHEFNTDPNSKRHPFFTAWASKWDISDEEILYTTGNTSDNKIYMIGRDGELIAEFGKDVLQIELTEKEMDQKVQRAGRISSNPSRLAESSAFKPIFINIAIDENGTIWAHRNKSYGAQEELDVYTLNGEYITTVTLPSSGNEY